MAAAALTEQTALTGRKAPRDSRGLSAPMVARARRGHPEQTVQLAIEGLRVTRACRAPMVKTARTAKTVPQVRMGPTVGMANLAT